MLTIVGFVMLFIGAIALILSLVGLRLSMLSFVENYDSMLAFVLKIVLLFGGATLIFVARSGEDPEMD